MPTPPQPDLESFLADCRSSSAAAFARFEALLKSLTDSETRARSRRFLALLEQAIGQGEVTETLKTYHVAFQRLPVNHRSRELPPLRMLLFPSVFMPEQWSRTFFEGLSRVPDRDFEGRTIVELGCGSGWISLALGLRASPAKVFGLDINPKAVACARINLFLNGLDDHGEPVLDPEGRCLLDRVEFHVSDLLDQIRLRDLKVDYVCGCIPQVLDPDLETAEVISAEATDEALHALSNYTARQGYLEDQFGLGLVARALDEAALSLRAKGRVLFNLGGRPGAPLLLHLFQRRGFEVQELWRRRIPQAADTDISTLADIEARANHRFEFFLGPFGDEPIGARTARAYQDSGGEIFHGLTVVEGRLRHPVSLQRLYETLARPELGSVRDSLDLSFADDSILEEKLRFLGRLADNQAERSSFPYESTLGTSRLRRHLAQFFASYLGIGVSPECFAVLPNRNTAIYNLMKVLAPDRCLLRPSVSDGWLPWDRGEVLECPASVDPLCRLVETIQPQLVVTRLPPHETRNRSPLLRLLEVTGKAGARLVVDLSDTLDLESTPEVTGALQALAEEPLPPHATALFSLEKNRVYPDLELCCLLSENLDLLGALSKAAEVTYSRTPTVSQDYFDTILGDLLAFRLDSLEGSAGEVKRNPVPEDGNVPSGAPWIQACSQAFEHAALATDHGPVSPKTLRLDYGENALPSPSFVQRCLFQAFARKETRPVVLDLEMEIGTLLRRRFGLKTGKAASRPSSFHFGLGVSPLFAALAEVCASEAGTFLFPGGSYGYFVAAVLFNGGETRRIPTQPGNGCKLEPAELDRALSQVKRPWLYLNGPVVNPTGSIYSAQEIHEILAVAAQHRARVVLDVLFSGLEFGEVEPWDLDSVLDDHLLDMIVLGGISKELAAGGLRFGFSHSNSPVLARALSSGTMAVPHGTILDAVQQVYFHLNHPTADIRAEMASQRARLKGHSEKLAAALTSTGWEILPPEGGLFLSARPTEYLGRRFPGMDGTGAAGELLDSENLPDALFQATGLLINGSAWTGIPGYCRFVHSVPEDDLDEAGRRLQAFHARVIGT